MCSIKCCNLRNAINMKFELKFKGTGIATPFTYVFVSFYLYN